MKKALIDTRTNVQHIVSWAIDPQTKLYKAFYAEYPNSCRVCEVTDTTFEVYPTLIWVDCADDVVADLFWYDSSSQTINPVENAPVPEPVQLTTEGTQTL